MNTTIKFAALGAVALAATSTAALAGSQTPPGLSAGIPLAAPLPEGVYDLSIGLVQQNNPAGGLEAALPVWLIWSTPYQIAGGRIQLDGTMPFANVDNGPIGFQNGLTNASIHWNLGNGLNFGESVGVYWAGSGSGLADPKNRFMGHTDVAYIAGGWVLSANFIYGSSDSSVDAPSYLNYDLAAVRKLGKFEAGVVAYGSTDLDNQHLIAPTGAMGCPSGCKQSQFAVGGLVGYDFGSFSGNFKLTQDVSEQNYGYKNTTAWVTIVKPLWSPASEGPLK